MSSPQPPPSRLFNARSTRIAGAACYTYESLGPSQIRLLKLLPGQPGDALQCELKQTSLQKAPRYLALSYAWGDNVQDQPIQVRHDAESWSELMVTRNLLAALLRLRHAVDVCYLWADQVCIAQKDDVEKGLQVQLMDKIYACAAKAVVWLGGHDDDTPLIREMAERLTPSPASAGDISYMHLMDQLAVRDLIHEPGRGASPARARRKAVERFLDRTWFRRAWVYQEAIVAADVAVYCGDFCVSLDVLARMVLATYYLAKLEKDGFWCRVLKRSKGFGPLRAIWYDRRQFHQRDAREPLNFLHILWRGRKYLEATKPGDMVYSFLAFDDSTAEHRIHADYTISPQETYTRLARAMIKSRRSLDILQCVVATKSPRSVGPGLPPTPTPHLPSWVPDWSNRRFTSGAPLLCPGTPSDFDACRGRPHEWTGGDAHVLYVRGHIVDSIHAIIAHDCDESTYFKASLRQVLKLDALLGLVDDAMQRAAAELDTARTSTADAWPGCDPRIHPRRTYDDVPATTLRTLLADGAFGRAQPIERQATLSELLRVYRSEGNRLFSLADAGDAVLHRYMRDTGSVAKGKRPFLTPHLDLGLGASDLRRGDVVVVLYGSQAPCVLRRKSHQSKEYRFMGQCYLDGWMYGSNPRRYHWWEKEPKTFALV